MQGFLWYTGTQRLTKIWKCFSQSNSVLCCFEHEDFQVFSVITNYGGVQKFYLFILTNFGLYNLGLTNLGLTNLGITHMVKLWPVVFSSNHLHI